MRLPGCKGSSSHHVSLRRRAVSEIIAATILFAAFFVTGTGLFLFVNNMTSQANQANASNSNAGLQASQEKLLVSVKPSHIVGQTLGVRANNTGGIPVTIVDAYITCEADCGPTYKSSQLLSSSTNPSSLGSHFLSQSPDLNVSLPITLGIGASTKGSDIGINLASCLFCSLIGSGEYVVVSLLTSRGNVFSAQYPAPPIPSNTQVTVQDQTTQINEVLIGGGPQLSVLLSATAICPSGSGGCTQTFSCNDGCITVTATVYNYATAAASNVALNLQTPYSLFVSGTASVSLYSSCTPSAQTIPPSGTGTITCQFSAQTGATGGLAAFSGSVSASISGVSVTSAEALSNSIEVGGLASVTTQGAFAANFFFLKYSSCVQDSLTLGSYQSPCTTNVSPWPPTTVNNLPSASGIGAGENYYVAFYLQITNVFNATLPILQWTYTWGDPTISGEVYYFLAGSNTTETNGVYYPNYGASGGTPTLTPYPTDCYNVGANGKPTDPACIYVNPGQTVTLTFAACGYGASNWAWGGQQDASSFDSSTGCTGNPPALSVPEGMTLGPVISFEYKGTIYSQGLPFEAQAYDRSSLTTLSCVPSSVGAGSPTTCTATVADSDANPPTCPGNTLCPGGTITFGGQAATLGTFSSNTCTLSSGSCSVTYTPNLGNYGPVGMTATYGGDDYHTGSSASTTVTILRGTSTTVSCSPSTDPVNIATTCTATVTDTSSIPVTPTGTVSFSTAPASSGSFSPASCTLSGSGSTASCTTQFTPSSGKEGSITVTGSYSGDSLHVASSGAATVTATKRTTSISVSCSPASVPVTGPTTCTATVTDTSSGTAIAPTGGTVTFSASPSTSGSFSPASAQCTTSAGTCTVTYTPSAGKEGTITITATYAGDTDHSGSGPSAGFSLTVTKITTTTAVVCSPNPDGLNTPSTCTATVSDSAGATETPTGTITFSASPTGDGSFSSTTCTLSGGACSVTFTPSSVASITITGSYGGDGDHLTSIGSTTLTTAKRTTSTTVTCTPSSLAINQASTCTVTVADTGGSGSTTPTGTITFSASPSGDGSFSAGTCTLSAGSCSVTFTPSAAASITITASYGGDSVHATSSGTASITSSKRTTSTTVSCSPATVVVNQGTTCTVTVSDTSGTGSTTPTGTVTFSAVVGSFSATTCTLSSGTCSVTYTPGSGSQSSSPVTITASYGGDSAHATSSGTTSVTINKRSVSVSITCSPTSVGPSGTATCTVTVTDTSTGTAITPTGTVSFTISGWTGSASHTPTIGGTCTLNSSGQCSVTFTGNGGAGTATITATYNGDTNHSTGTGTKTETVT